MIEVGAIAESLSLLATFIAGFAFASFVYLVGYFSQEHATHIKNNQEKNSARIEYYIISTTILMLTSFVVSAIVAYLYASTVSQPKESIVEYYINANVAFVIGLSVICL